MIPILGQLIIGAILIGFGAVVATEVSRNNRLAPDNSPVVVTPSTTATSTPTVAVATPSLVTQPQKGTTVATDGTIDCRFPHSGTLRVTSSKCDAMTDCEISAGKWQPVFKTDCDTLHKSQQKTANTVSVQNSTANAPTGSTELYFSKLLGASYTCSTSSVNAIKSAEDAYFYELDKRTACTGKVSSDKSSCLTSCSTKHSDTLKTCSSSFNSQVCLDSAWANYQSCQKNCEPIIMTSDTCYALSEGLLASYSKQVNDLVKKNCP